MTNEAGTVTSATPIDFIECRLGTYVAKLALSCPGQGAPTSEKVWTGGRFEQVDRRKETSRGYDARLREWTRKARSVVTAWKGPLFRGAEFRLVYTDRRSDPINLTSVCAMFDVTAPKETTSMKKATKPATAKPAKAPKGEVTIKPSAPILVTSLIPKKAEAATEPTTVRDLPTALYTIGYGAGLSVSTLMDIMKARDIGYVVDTRPNTATHVPGWSGQKLREAFGTRYRSVQTLSDVKAWIEPVKCPRAIFIRKEEAPGDCNFNLEIARIYPVTHLFRNEAIKGNELQRAIDQGDDYECEIVDEVVVEALASAVG